MRYVKNLAINGSFDGKAYGSNHVYLNGTDQSVNLPVIHDSATLNLPTTIKNSYFVGSSDCTYWNTGGKDALSLDWFDLAQYGSVTLTMTDCNRYIYQFKNDTTCFPAVTDPRSETDFSTVDIIQIPQDATHMRIFYSYDKAISTVSVSVSNTSIPSNSNLTYYDVATKAFKQLTNTEIPVDSVFNMTTPFSHYFTHTKPLTANELAELNANPNKLYDVWFNGDTLVDGFAKSDMVNFVPGNFVEDNNVILRTYNVYKDAYSMYRTEQDDESLQSWDITEGFKVVLKMAKMSENLVAGQTSNLILRTLYGAATGRWSIGFYVDSPTDWFFWDIKTNIKYTFNKPNFTDEVTIEKKNGNLWVDGVDTGTALPDIVGSAGNFCSLGGYPKSDGTQAIDSGMWGEHFYEKIEVNGEVFDISGMTENSVTTSSGRTFNRIVSLGTPPPGKISDVTIDLVDIANNSTYEIVNFTDACKTTYQNVDYGATNLLLEQDSTGIPTGITPPYTIDVTSGDVDTTVRPNLPVYTIEEVVELADGTTEARVLIHDTTDEYFIGGVGQATVPPLPDPNTTMKLDSTALIGNPDVINKEKRHFRFWSIARHPHATVPRVLHSKILQDTPNGIRITWDRPMEMTCDIKNQIKVIHGAVETAPTHVIFSASKKEMGLVMPTDFTVGEVVTWAYDDTGPCTLQGAFTPNIEADNQTYAVDNQLVPAPTVRFKCTATSAVEPTATEVVGGTLTYADNGDGTWTIESTDTITKASWVQNTDITTFEVIKAMDLTEVGHAELEADGSPGAGSWGSWTGCSSLISFDASGLTNVTDVSLAWAGCSSLTSFDTSTLTNITDATYSWYGCIGLTSFDTSSMTSVVDIASAWSGCENIITFDASGLTSAVNVEKAWSECRKMTSFDTSALTNVTSIPLTWFRCEGLVSFDSSGLTQVTDVSEAWEECLVLETFDASGLTNVTDITRAWFQCIVLTSFDTTSMTKVVEASAAWRGCSKLKTFNASGLINVENLDSAWRDCHLIEPFGISALTKATNINRAWEGCSIKIVSFDTSSLTSVTHAEAAWKNCTNLSSFNASGLVNVSNLNNAWGNCGNLLCISSFTAPNVTDVTDAFANTPKLVHPNTAEQTQYFTASGVNWVNPEPCPLPPEGSTSSDSTSVSADSDQITVDKE